MALGGGPSTTRLDESLMLRNQNWKELVFQIININI